MTRSQGRSYVLNRSMLLVIVAVLLGQGFPQRVQPKAADVEKNRRAAVETRNVAFAFENGRNGQERNDREAARLYRLAADRGDTVSMGRLAQMYADGRGVASKSNAEASAWWRTAAKLGDARAQYSLALFHYSGQSDVKSGHLSKAVELMKLSAEQGFVKAQFNFGLMHERGVPGADLKPNVELAVKWYLASANQGYPPAQYNLGLMLRQGRGVPQSDREATNWLTKAAEQGHAHARHKLTHVEVSRLRGRVENSERALRLAVQGMFRSLKGTFLVICVLCGVSVAFKVSVEGLYIHLTPPDISPVFLHFLHWQRPTAPMRQHLRHPQRWRRRLLLSTPRPLAKLVVVL